MARFEIRQATEADVPVILRFIRALAEYEKLSHKVVAIKVELERLREQVQNIE